MDNIRLVPIYLLSFNALLLTYPFSFYLNVTSIYLIFIRRKNMKYGIIALGGDLKRNKMVYTYK